jgi:3-hydroxyacyl-CoA dehydrogenase/enoyl-CoA hydratase/carnithine racemase
MAAQKIDDIVARAHQLASEDEVVTSARLRSVPLPGGQHTMGLITLDNGRDHTRPNTLGPRGLLSLNSAIDEALADPEIDAIGVTGKPFILAAGADLTTIATAGADAVRTIAELGHAVFGKLSGTKPSFGFVNGLALGGGLEVALNCDYRTVLDSAAAIGLPEVMLGILPGWGGSYLLPRLVGTDRAVTVAIENPLSNGKVLKGADAYALGLADMCYSGADYLEQSLTWAAGVLNGSITVQRPAVDTGVAWEEGLARGRAIADAKTGGAAPAAYRALELMAAAKTSTKVDAFAAEDQALVDLSLTPEARCSLYAFDLVQKRAKRPAGAPESGLAQPITKVGIVGAGLMASQLALLFVRRLQVPVVLTDLDKQRVAKGIEYVAAEIDKLLSKGRLTSDQAARYRALVSGSVDQTVFADADFIIEAVFEEMEVKKQVFAALEKVAQPQAIFATNTSSLSITEMASDLTHPERLVGFHFFNPVAVMPLLEVIAGKETNEVTLATAFSTVKALKKTGILVKDSPSFVVNRLLGRMLAEVGTIVDEGTSLEVADSAFSGITPMAPFALLSLVGPTIALHNSETLAQAFPDRYRVPTGLQKLVAAGLASYYGSNGAFLAEAVALQVVPEKPVVLDATQVQHRTLCALTDEARRMLDEGVVAGPQDLDLAMIMGAGFPFWRGGLTLGLDLAGISQEVTGRSFH